MWGSAPTREQSCNGQRRVTSLPVRFPTPLVARTRIDSLARAVLGSGGLPLTPVLHDRAPLCTRRQPGLGEAGTSTRQLQPTRSSTRLSQQLCAGSRQIVRTRGGHHCALVGPVARRIADIACAAVSASITRRTTMMWSSIYETITDASEIAKCPADHRIQLRFRSFSQPSGRTQTFKYKNIVSRVSICLSSCLHLAIAFTAIARLDHPSHLVAFLSPPPRAMQVRCALCLAYPSGRAGPRLPCSAQCTVRAGSDHAALSVPLCWSVCS